MRIIDVDSFERAIHTMEIHEDEIKGVRFALSFLDLFAIELSPAGRALIAGEIHTHREKYGEATYGRV